MITFPQTNFLYLADTLPNKQPVFYPLFEKLLKELNIPLESLPGTNDIWARDYMPIQISKDKFIRFDYNPTYLQTPKWLKTITNVDAVCKRIEIKTNKSKILVDGGNVVNSSNKVIMTERVFKENPSYKREALVKELKQLFETDELFFIPSQPYDFTGHADGMVRFVDDNTILINDYKKESATFMKTFDRAIQKTGLTCIKIPYNPCKDNEKANGIYMNYLEIGNIIIVPTFGMEEDEIAIRKFEQIFERKTIRSIDSNEIADEGGILHCISWNILK